MEQPLPRPNVSREELRRSFQDSDPASRLRPGFRLSRFGARLQGAMKEASARDQDRIDLAALRQAREEDQA